MTSKLDAGRSSADRRVNKGSILSASLSVGTTTENCTVLVIAALGEPDDVEERERKDRKLVGSGKLIKEFT